MNRSLKIATTTFNKLYQASFDYFFAPPFCAYCKKFLQERTIFCLDCFSIIQPVVSKQITITKIHSLQVMAVGAYEEPLKTLILAKSWNDITACNQLASLIWDKTYFQQMNCDYIIPIPLHWRRFAKRGYNQAEEIAQALACKKKVTMQPIIKRMQNTPFQSSLAFNKRLDNVKQAFVLQEIDYQKYHNKHIVLVDDLMTTGATLASAAKVLLPLKPASISAIVAARVI